MTKIIAEPFDWNDNMAEIAQEDFSLIRKDLSYGAATTIGTALAKLELLEKQGCKVEPQKSDETHRWIPVSERLPEEGEEVLVSGYDIYNKKVIIARYQGEQYGFTCGLVSAWMPLPKPYKPQESEDKEWD